ncbi:hypothetical protein Tco_0748543 [Tanacetum coccineum]|uniref:Uncharacterized protein n=1 Tax=Tanacetum coccineum TaxID=301880 RepID=A0ABQ4YYX5_9ASTR
MSSIKKTFVVHEKTMTPRSGLRWKPTGKIFKTVGLRWVPTGKIFTYSTTNVDSEPQNGSNADISNQYESAQTLDVSAVQNSEFTTTAMNCQVQSWFQKVVPLETKTATSRQELEFLFHHHLTNAEGHIGATPLVFTMTNGNPSSVIIKQHCVVCLRRSGNENKQHSSGYNKDGDGDASFLQGVSNFIPHAHAQTTKTFYKHQDSRIMKAQELKTKTSAQTLIYKIFLQRYQVYQGRLLASFQDDAKYEHVGQDTRSQGGKDDQKTTKE